MIHVLATATATQASANDHFELTLLWISVGVAVIGWMLRRQIAQSDARHSRVDKDLDDLTARIGRIEEGIASLKGRHWWSR